MSFEIHFITVVIERNTQTNDFQDAFLAFQHFCDMLDPAYNLCCLVTNDDEGLVRRVSVVRFFMNKESLSMLFLCFL